MIEITRQKVPSAEFRVESLFNCEIPTSCAVISIGEGVNYQFEENCDRSSLITLFQIKSTTRKLY